MYICIYDIYTLGHKNLYTYVYKLLVYLYTCIYTLIYKNSVIINLYLFLFLFLLLFVRNVIVFSCCMRAVRKNRLPDWFLVSTCRPNRLYHM